MVLHQFTLLHLTMKRLLSFVMNFKFKVSCSKLYCLISHNEDTYAYSCCPHCVAHFIFIPLLSSPSGKPQVQILLPNILATPDFLLWQFFTIRCSLRRSWWGLPGVLVYNFVFNHLFGSILRNWPPKLG